MIRPGRSFDISVVRLGTFGKQLAPRPVPSMQGCRRHADHLDAHAILHAGDSLRLRTVLPTRVEEETNPVGTGDVEFMVVAWPAKAPRCVPEPRRASSRSREPLCARSW